MKVQVIFKLIDEQNEEVPVPFHNKFEANLPIKCSNDDFSTLLSQAIPRIICSAARGFNFSDFENTPGVRSEYENSLGRSAAHKRSQKIFGNEIDLPLERLDII